MTLDISPIVTILVEIIIGVLGAILAWASTYIPGLLKLNQDSKVRGYLQEAIERSIDYAVEVTRRRGEDLSSLQVRESVTFRAVEYLINRVPDALNHFEIDKDSARAMVQARVSRLLFQ